MSAWEHLLDGLDPLVAGTRLIGTLAADHPGSNGKDLTDVGRLKKRNERDPLLPAGFAPDDTREGLEPHVDEGILAPIAPRRAGTEQPENDEIDDGFEEMTGIKEDKIEDMQLALRVDDGEDEVVFNLIDKKTKKRLGFVGVRSDNSADVDGYWQVDFSDFELDQNKPISGKGLGPVVYAKINDWLKKHKQSRLMSDTERSVPAEKMWQKIVATGKAKKKSDPKKSWQGEPFDYYVMETVRQIFETSLSTKRLPGWITVDENIDEDAPAVADDPDDDNIRSGESVDEYVERVRRDLDVRTPDPKHLFHISLLSNLKSKGLNDTPKTLTLRAQVSPNRMQDEDSTTPRVCFVLHNDEQHAVSRALQALGIEPSTNVGKRLAVFSPAKHIDVVIPETKPSKEQLASKIRAQRLKFVVPDARGTKEVWALTDTPCVLVRVIELTDALANDPNGEAPEYNDVAESLIFEDSRGNMTRLLKAPPTVVALFDEVYGRYAFPMLASAMKRDQAQDARVDDDLGQLVNVNKFWGSNIDEFGELAAKNFLGDFQETDSIDEKILNAIKRRPQLLSIVNDMKKTWSQTLLPVVASLKSDPKTALERAKKEGLVLAGNWFWLPLTKEECSIEASEMGHCGEDERGQLWSLRDPQNKAHVTLTFQEDEHMNGRTVNVVHQIKGKQNRAPEIRYWPYIEEFFRKMKVKSLSDIELDGNAPALFAKLEDIIERNKNGSEHRDTGPSHRELHGFDIGDNIQRFEGALSECFMVEQDMPVNSYQMKFAMTKQNGEDCATVTLVDRSGKKAGEVKAFDDDTTGGFKIVNAHVRDQRKGVGMAVYRKFNEWLKKHTGKHLTSDLIRSDEADGLWNKMVSNGLAKKQVASIKGQYAKDLGKQEFFVMENVVTEDAKDDLMLRLKFREKQEDDQKVLNVTIWSDYEETGVGFVRTFIDEKNKLIRILSAHLHPGYEKKGIGLWAYEQIDAYAKKHFGSKLASDTERFAAANGLWKKLTSLGKAKHVQNHFSQGYYEFV